MMDKDCAELERYSEICDESFSKTVEELGDVLLSVKENITQYTLGELACYLRANYRRAEYIPNYHDFRLAVFEYCKSQDGDMRIFHGLIDYKPWKSMF